MGNIGKISRADFNSQKEEAERSLRNSFAIVNGMKDITNKTQHDKAQRQLDQLANMEAEGMVE